MKRALLTHPKTNDLTARLGCTRPTTIGYLSLLFDFCADHSPQGDIGKWPDGAIALGCDWTDPPELFIQALIDSKWIDRHGLHRLIIHDWSENCDNWVRAKIKKMDLQFVTYDASYEGSYDREKTTLEATSLSLSLPLPSLVPNLSSLVSSKPTSAGADSCRAALDLSAEIHTVFDYYKTHHPKSHPKPSSTSKEWKVIRARLIEGYTVDDLTMAINGCHLTPHNLGANARNTKYLSLDLIMRDGSQVTRFAENAKNPPRPTSEKEQRTLDAASRWLERKNGNAGT